MNNLLKLFLIMVILNVIGFNNRYSWVEKLPKPWLLREEKISEILPQFFKKYPKFENRLKALTIWRIGTPYKEFKLGEEFPPDSDPLFRLDVSDCTVHVLTTLTLAQSINWEQARENIIKIHYKLNEGGLHKPTYSSRWHFTADRILFNPSTVNITNELIDSSRLKSVEITLNKKEDGSQLIDINWTKNIKLEYIPNKYINKELLNKLPEICGIAFVRESYFKNGLAIAHEGIVFDKKYLVHASSIEGKTVKVKFLDYYFNKEKSKFDGIMIYSFVPLD